MRFRRLRSMLRKIAFAGLVVACDCPDAVHKTIVIDMPDETLLPLVERCRADAADCEAMCKELANRFEYQGAGDSIVFDECGLRAGTPESAYYVYTPDCVGGRRPAGFRPRTAVAAAGGWFALQAELEAASVRAFLDLARDLLSHGAPAHLVRAARRSAADEVLHADLCAHLARRHGARPTAPLIAPFTPRSLEALALENAVEGCVRETWGALLATRQAVTSHDPAVRLVMARIASDETRHAALSLAIDAWVRRRVDARALDDARAEAIAELEATLGDTPDELVTIAGLPGETDASRMFGELFAT